jgi:hypothetical protein
METSRKASLSLSLSLKISSQPNDFVLEERLRMAHNVVAITPISTPTEQNLTSLKIGALYLSEATN